MIRLAILRSPNTSADAIPLLAKDSGAFDVLPLEIHAGQVQSLPVDLVKAAPEVLLLDVDDWERSRTLLGLILKAARNLAIIGYRTTWTPEDEAEMTAAGVTQILKRPFSALELDVAARTALHQCRPMAHPNVLAFLPSKAGSGCSTVVLNTAAVLANNMGQKTLVIEADRRSGSMGILLNVEDRGGLPAIISETDRLTPVGWRQHVVSIGKLDMLLANPLRPGPPPTWATYFQILDFAQRQYNFILVDLPELINPATPSWPRLRATCSSCVSRNLHP
jgi:Flp pilus assembly CpaE family ATPase